MLTSSVIRLRETKTTVRYYYVSISKWAREVLGRVWSNWSPQALLVRTETPSTQENIGAVFCKAKHNMYYATQQF